MTLVSTPPAASSGNAAVELFITQSGHLSAKASVGGATVFVHSQYDPEREALNAAAKTPQAQAYCVLGCGLGFLPLALAQKNPQAGILAVEFNPHLSERARKRLLPLGLNGALLSDPDVQAATEWIAGRAGEVFFLSLAPGLKLDAERYRSFSAGLYLALIEVARARIEKEKKPLEALPLLQSAENILAGHGAAAYFAGRALLAAGRYEEAAARWERGLEACADAEVRSRMHLDLCRLWEMIRDGEPEFVAAQYRKIEENYPGTGASAAAQKALGRIYISPRYRRIVHEQPVIMQIEPTNACNLSCRMCPRGSMRRPVGFMDVDRFREIVRQGRRNAVLRLVKLYFMGEPILHPRLLDLIRAARQLGVPSVGIQTNACRLDEAYARALLESGVYDVGISLETSSREGCGHVRRPGEEGIVEENVRKLVELRNRTGSKARITLTAVDMGEEETAKEAFRARWRGIVDTACFVDYTPHEKTVSGEGVAPKAKTICREPFEKLTVLWTGQAVGCCVDYDGKFPLGQLPEEDLGKVWLGERAQELRRHISGGRYDEHPFCAACPLYFEGMKKTAALGAVCDNTKEETQ